jgi:predicted ATPase/DNA-binding CsgD family transcriptional regulator
MTDKLSAPLGEFKEREIEIIGLMAEGLTNQEIADQLFVTKETVRWYNKQIYSKLGTSRRTEAIALAREMGLIGDTAKETDTVQPIQHHLPLTTGPFIGRDEELAELSTLLEKPEIRLLSIVAAGGMGKSRLSLELGHLIQSRYAHGAAFIDLTPLQNPDDICKAAVSSLGLTANGRQSPQDLFFNYCREKSLLLIFDNFEDVLPGANLLAELLAIAPHVKILVTTRERLNLRVETVYSLQPVTRSGARLFREMALIARPNLIIAEEDEVDVQRIVDVVGGLPLALVLAANWVDTLSIGEIAAEIAGNLDFLSAELGDMPPRQHSIHAVIDPTWKRLSAEEQKAFIDTAVFRGGFTREAFQQVTGASLRTLQTLLRRSLVSQGHGRRYDLHPLIRQYAAEKLVALQRVEPAKQAHLQTFRRIAEKQAELFFTRQIVPALEACDMEHENFRAALDYAFSGTSTAEGAALTLALSRFWQTRSHIAEGSVYLELATNHQPDNARLYDQLGFFQYRLGQIEQAERTIKKAIALAKKSQLLDVLANSSRILFFLDNSPLGEAEPQIAKALALAEQSGVQHIIAYSHVEYGLLLYAAGVRLPEALTHFRKALSILEEMGDLPGISATTYNMAILHHNLRNKEQSRAFCEYSLTMKRELGDRAGVARRLAVLATWDMVDEEFARAQSYLAESYTICAQLGEPQRLTATLIAKGQLHTLQQAFSDAETVYQKAISLAQRSENQTNLIAGHANIGLLYLLQGKIAKAKPHISQAIAANIDTSFDPWTAMTAYASVLWYAEDLTACLPIAAVMSRQLEEVGRGSVILNKYFLRPLLYRLQERIGDKAWQAARDTTTDITVEHLFTEISSTYQTKITRP